MNVSLVARAKKRVAVAVAGVGVASVLFLAGGGGGSVSAHDVLISGSASCADDGRYTINYTSTAWSGNPGDDSSRTNPSIIVYASFNNGNNQQVGTGAFAAPSFSFGGQFTTPAGTSSVVIQAYVAGTWGNGFGGGQQSSATVSLPSNCTTTTTTTEPTTTTTTTVPPTTTTTTTTSTTTTTTTTSTTTTTLPPGDDGCTPGYWKNHTNRWQGYTTGQTLESVFNVPDSFGLDNNTLLQALSFDGGSGNAAAARILLRAGTAALLNSAHSGVDYQLTTAEVIAGVNAALASNDRDTMLGMATSLDNDNNLGCTLN